MYIGIVAVGGNGVFVGDGVLVGWTGVGVLVAVGGTGVFVGVGGGGVFVAVGCGPLTAVPPPKSSTSASAAS